MHSAETNENKPGPEWLSEFVSFPIPPFPLFPPSHRLLLSFFLSFFLFSPFSAALSFLLSFFLSFFLFSSASAPLFLIHLPSSAASTPFAVPVSSERWGVGRGRDDLAFARLFVSSYRKQMIGMVLRFEIDFFFLFTLFFKFFKGFKGGFFFL